MDMPAPASSARILSAAPTAPYSASSASSAGSSPSNTAPALITLWRRYDAEPVLLLRTREGRALSHARYRTAHEFRSGVADDRSREVTDVFYMAGIVAQLALSSHLLDVGFPDAWCARHISLHVDRSLAYANATGFGYEDPETARLMQVLSPYWKWNAQHLIGRPIPSHGDFTREALERLLDALLEHVSEVTGHVLTKPRKRRVAAPA